MPAGTPDDWLYSDWLLIARILEKLKHDDCRCYECDTIDALLEDIAHYWDLDEDQRIGESFTNTQDLRDGEE